MGLSSVELEAYRYGLLKATVLDNPYISHNPWPKQAIGLVSDAPEIFYGGAGGGGKSDFLLMAALQWVECPNYAGLLLRRTFTDLSLPGSLLDRAQEWLLPTDARWHDKTKTFHFPSGATLTFGYLEHESDKTHYQGAEFQFVGFDEVTHFTESMYTYLFSRTRRLEGSIVPIRVCATSNPGGIGHEWVKERFILSNNPDRLCVRARLEDNPALDLAEYEKSLSHLDPVTRERIRNGDWDISVSGSKFKREWFEIVTTVPAQMRLVRCWDLAAKEPKPDKSGAPSKQPDYTVGVLMGESKGIFYILDVLRVRTTPGNVEALIRQTAELDGIGVTIVVEQDPGSAGLALFDHYRKTVLKGFATYSSKTTGSKEVRALPFSAAAQAGNVKLLYGRWIKDYLDELELFPMSVKDDQVDASSAAFNRLATKVTPVFGSTDSQTLEKVQEEAQTQIAPKQTQTQEEGFGLCLKRRWGFGLIR